MKKIKVAGCVLLVMISCFLLSGYAAAPKQNAYFTIYFDNQKIVVTDSYLKPAWYNTESKESFKPIYQRLDDYKKGTFVKTFPELYQIVQKIALDINTDAFDGTLHFNTDKDQMFNVVGTKDGRALDTRRLCIDILAALKSKKHADIIAQVITIKPKTEQEVLEQKAALRANYSTRFDDSNLERAGNIKLSAECFNGLTIEPGERISFNKTVGARTAARGYQEANIILDGEFVKGIGGGVCQTSTTLFNAAMLSGMSIETSCNHSLPISYVPIGRDAMVSSVVDLVFENNTGSPIYIESGVKGNRVYFKIYGAKLSVKYKPRVVVTEGEEETRTLTYIEAFKGEKLVNSKLVRKSRYKHKKEEIEKQEETEKIIPAPTENLPRPLISHISA